MDTELLEIQRIIGSGHVYLREFSVKQVVPENCLEDDCVVTCTMALSRGRVEAPFLTLSFSKVNNIEFRGGAYQTIRIVGLEISEIPGVDAGSVQVRVASEDDDSYILFYGKSFSVLPS